MSSHLQTLATSKYYHQIQDAVEKNDKNLIIKVCRKAKIPKVDINPIVALLLSINNAVKWPEGF